MTYQVLLQRPVFLLIIFFDKFCCTYIGSVLLIGFHECMDPTLGYEIFNIYLNYNHEVSVIFLWQ